jgi:hypothetical protein
MKNKSKDIRDTGFAITSKLWLLAFVVTVIAGTGCGSQSSRSGATAGNPAGNDYILTYEWPEKPKVGSYTLKVNLTDRAGAPVEDADVVLSYDMPSMRGSHATTETMKRNARGDYLLPIHFVMPGDWEIVVSALRDEVEIAAELILLDI